MSKVTLKVKGTAKAAPTPEKTPTKAPVTRAERMNALEPEVLADLEMRLQQGDTPRAVATVAQEEHGVFLDLSADALRKLLERYARTELREKLLAQGIAANAGVPIEVAAKRINAMLALEDLVGAQTERFHKARETEAKMPLPLKAVREEIKVLGSLLVRLGGLQLETGFLQRVPKTVHGTVTDPKTGTVSEFSWTQQQAKLMEELEGAVHDLDD